MKYLNSILFPALMLVSFSGFAGGGHGDGLNDAKSATDMDHSKMNPADMGHWTAPAAEMNKKNPVTADTVSISQGQKLYQQNCAACHGANADGQGMAGMMLNPKPANLRAMAGQHPDGDFAYKIREGRGPMPGWKNSLNDTQVWHLVNYIQALNGPESSKQESHSSHSH